jgi:hypothetical protein
MIVFTGCGGGSPSRGEKGGRSASLTFQLNFASPSGESSETPGVRAISEPDVCRDHQIDTIAVKVHRAVDNSEVASAQSECSDHSLTVTKVPANEELFVVCRGSGGGEIIWQGRKDGIIAAASQNTNIGAIDMTYVGADSAAPFIVSNFPTADASDVDLKAWVWVAFNEPLAPSSIADDAVKVLVDNSLVEGQASYDPATHSIRFVPAAATGFEPETTYEVSLHPEDNDGNVITDTAGLPFTGTTIQWQFSTRGATDTTSPQVIAVSPVSSAVDVATQTVVTAQFSEPVDPQTLTDDALQLSTDQGVIQGALSYDTTARTLTLTPEQPLDEATQYTAIVSTLVKDPAGNALAEPYTWQFKTIGPKFNLTVTKPGSGSGTVVSTPAGINCGTACQAAMDVGSTITLEATADANSKFTGWSGDACDGTTEPCIFSMDADKTIAANFSIRAYTITVSVVPADGSRGVIIPAGATVIHGEDQTFEINAKPHFHIAELIVNGNSVTPADSYRFENVTANHTIQAVFEANATQISDDQTWAVTSPQINANGHVVWSGGKGSDEEIWYFNGSLPPSPVNISQAPDDNDMKPQINAAGHVVWYRLVSLNYDIYYHNQTQVNLISVDPDDPDKFAGYDVRPQLNAKGQVVWESNQGSDYEIFFYDGSTMTTPANISQNPGSQDRDPQINDAGQVVWTRYNSTGTDIYLYDPAIQTEPINISNKPQFDNEKPQINNAGQVVWQSYNGEFSRIYYFDGTMPPQSVNVTENLDVDCYDPQINAAGEAVWYGELISYGYDVYYFDGSLPPNPQNLTNSSGVEDFDPQINASGQIVWYSDVGTDYEIFFFDKSLWPKPINISSNPDQVDRRPKINDSGMVVWEVGGEGVDSLEINLSCIAPCTDQSEN